MCSFSVLCNNSIILRTCLYDSIRISNLNLIADLLSLSLDFLNLLRSGVNQGQYFCDTLRRWRGACFSIRLSLDVALVLTFCCVKFNFLNKSMINPRHIYRKNPNLKFELNLTQAYDVMLDYLTNQQLRLRPWICVENV